MRKLSYVITFFAVAATLLFNVLSVYRPDWLVVNESSDILHTRYTAEYGLSQLCELALTDIPGGNGKVIYRSYECRGFPKRTTDKCEGENSSFCAAWISAGYLDEVAIGFAAVSLVSILFGVSTHSRRRRIWRAVAGLTLFQAVCQLITFSIITDTYRTSSYPAFEHARPGIAYVLNTLSWVFGFIITFGVVTTGISADRGRRWAAGNRAYQPIADD
ncbi:hypothetical protein BDQ17DRAFT_1343674 [Cyathus striatus]|nr:hypothetical protein BDQ17DRAFT_1343674 [Cyathus striatus]